ncbi:hypothetical protein BD779DRAFT_1672200 [Infundibulicybe gibba]|nr:hypothetical protein BD779DRAFT_1672200 [Infundibulicybe gibba]
METPHSAGSISLGTVEVGVMFALLTHGVLTLQAYDYFRRCTDPITMRLVISLIWAASSVHVACASWLLYSATITNHGVPIDSIKYPLALPAGSALGAVIHCSVQGVYIYRMFRFGHGWSVALLCSVLTAYEFGVGMAFSVIEARYNWEAALGRFEDAWAFLVYSFFGAAAVVDVAIAVSVTYYLRRGRNQVERTSFLIDRLVVWTIQTGAITSITAITVIILFAVHRENNAWLGVYTFLTNLYPLALIALLNGREHLKPPKDGAPRIDPQQL